MQDISDLLKEAKPLYFTRKRRRKQIKTLCAMFVLLLGVGSFIPQSKNTAFDYYLLSESEYSTLNSTAEGSSLEEMGMPVDDYGLLMVG